MIPIDRAVERIDLETGESDHACTMVLEYPDQNRPRPADQEYTRLRILCAVRNAAFNALPKASALTSLHLGEVAFPTPALLKLLAERTPRLARARFNAVTPETELAPWLRSGACDCLQLLELDRLLQHPANVHDGYNYELTEDSFSTGKSKYQVTSSSGLAQSRSLSWSICDVQCHVYVCAENIFGTAGIICPSMQTLRLPAGMLVTLDDVQRLVRCCPNLQSLTMIGITIMDDSIEPMEIWRRRNISIESIVAAMAPWAHSMVELALPVHDGYMVHSTGAGK